MGLHDGQVDAIRRDFLIRLVLDKFRIIRQDRWHTLYQRQWVRVYVDDVGIFVYRQHQGVGKRWIRLLGRSWDRCINKRVCQKTGQLFFIREGE